MEAQVRDAVEKHKKKEEDLEVSDIICHCIYLFIHSSCSHSEMYVTFSSHSLSRNSLKGNYSVVFYCNRSA